MAKQPSFLDTQLTNKKILVGIKDFFSKTKKKKAVLGLSGGIDSAICATLLAKALGPKNVTAILMPVKDRSLPENFSDAKALAKKLKIKPIIVELDQFCTPFSALPWKQSKIASSNLFARLRTVILYNYANSSDSIVCGTGNKTEFLLGYFTKFGDGAADFFPIGDLFKTQVRELAKYNGLPETFLTKSPSAELWAGQTDEDEIGVKYDQIDKILFKLIVEKMSWQQIVEVGYPISEVRRVLSLVQKNAHKTALSPVVKVYT